MTRRRSKKSYEEEKKPRTMLIVKEQVKIKGLDKPFEKEVRLNKKDKWFSINYPVLKVSDNLIQTDEVYAQSWKEAEEKWHTQVRVFESLGYAYESIILYNIDERGDYRDGSGIGFVFNWGVFRRIKNPDVYDRRLFFERGYKGAKNISINHSDVKEWKEMPWSEQAENFFMEISTQVQFIYERLDYFVNHVNLAEEIPNLKLLGSGT